MTDKELKPRGRRPKTEEIDESGLPPEDRYRAPALDKGLDILELLASQAHGLTRAEIVKEMDRSASEIYRMLERLVARHVQFGRTPEAVRLPAVAFGVAAAVELALLLSPQLLPKLIALTHLLVPLFLRVAARAE